LLGFPNIRVLLLVPFVRKKTTEDYLLSIYLVYEKLADKGEGVRASEVAKLLGISKPSVSEAVEKLKGMKLVRAKPYGNIFFTKKGLREVRRLVHARRVVEVFLSKFLGLEGNELLEETHKMEHALSEKTIKKLDDFVGHPRVCPHGKKIHVLGLKND